MKIAKRQLRKIILEQVNRWKYEWQPIDRGWFRDVEQDPEGYDTERRALSLLGLDSWPDDLYNVETITTEDDNEDYESAIENVVIDHEEGNVGIGTLDGEPVVLTNQWGMGTIWREE